MNDYAISARFGFLTEPIRASFDNVSLHPVPDHAQRLNLLLKNVNEDGFIYPPQVAMFTTEKATGSKHKIPNSERPAAVYNLPASHELSITTPLVIAHPNSDIVLLIQLLAFIFGTRLQLEEWRFEGRVPFKSKLAASITNECRVDFISRAYSWWKILPQSLQRRVINVFYTYNRAISAEWDWDSFTQQYIVFDAIFKLYSEIALSKNTISHKMRFKVLCQTYDILYNEEVVSELYNARNELFHEGIWASTMIGFQTAGNNAIHYPTHLTRLNARLLCSITGYKNSFTRSAWWAMGQFTFDKHSES